MVVHSNMFHGVHLLFAVQPDSSLSC